MTTGIATEVYSVLAEIVGAGYISMEPAICEGYRSGPGGYESGLGYERVMTRIPGCVILPETVDEVAGLLGQEFPELGPEEAQKIVTVTLGHGNLRDDFYSDEVTRPKEDERIVVHPARIDADVNSVVSFEGKLFNVLDISELEDGRFRYFLKR